MKYKSGARAGCCRPTIAPRPIPCPLTHEFLSQMLGVHRPTVSIAAGMLQKAGLIEYRRGVVTILDRRGLESASCNCYQLIAEEYERLTNSKVQD